MFSFNTAQVVSYKEVLLLFVFLWFSAQGLGGRYPTTEIHCFLTNFLKKFVRSMTERLLL